MNLLNITYKNKALLSDIKVLSFQFCARYTEVEDKFNLKVCIIQRFQLLSQIFEDWKLIRAYKYRSVLLTQFGLCGI